MIFSYRIYIKLSNVIKINYHLEQQKQHSFQDFEMMFQKKQIHQEDYLGNQWAPQVLQNMKNRSYFFC